MKEELLFFAISMRALRMELAVHSTLIQPKDMTMYSGIVQNMAQVNSIQEHQGAKSITFKTPFLLDEVKIGDSIAINGACLTATTVKGYEFTADLMYETLKRTNLGQLEKNDKVNMELPMRLSDRIGGHIIKGHIESTSKIIKIVDETNAKRCFIEMKPELAPYIIPQGSIAIDGMSITIIDVTKEYFSVGLIPHTQSITIAQYYKEGKVVNLESDYLARFTVKNHEQSYAK